MQRASFKCETPRFKLKSSRTFLAIKRCERTKIGKGFLSNHEAQNYGGRINVPIVVFLLRCSNTKYMYDMDVGCSLKGSTASVIAYSYAHPQLFNAMVEGETLEDGGIGDELLEMQEILWPIK